MKKLALTLVLILLLGFIQTPDFIDAANFTPHIMINQVYGSALKEDGAISNSFIELYNPLEIDVSLNGYSLQYIDRSKGWSVFSLSGTIPAKTSLLILCTSTGRVPQNPDAQYIIPDYDLTANFDIDNDAFTVALVKGKTAFRKNLINFEWERIVDLVSAYQNSDFKPINWEGSAPVYGISKQKSARRLHFLDSDDNAADFEILDYREIDILKQRPEKVFPHSLADGAWGEGIEPVMPNERLVFSHDAGIYSSSFNLTLKTGFKNSKIRYTTDGSEPHSRSKEYSSPIQIYDRTVDTNYVSKNLGPTYLIRGDSRGAHKGRNRSWIPDSQVTKGTVIKARVFDEDGLPISGVITKSYFVDVSNKYPDLPVISISSDNKNLFSGGIYSDHWLTTEVPVYFELIEPDGNVKVSQNMGAKIHGSSTRSFAQKSLRLYAKDSYEPSKPYVNYDIFDGNSVDISGNIIDSYKRFVIRNFGNDWTEGNDWRDPNIYGWGETVPVMMRDALVHSLSQGTNVGNMAYRTSVVFINGEFWGLYNIRSRIDEYFVADTYQLSGRDKAGVLTFSSKPPPNVGLPDDYNIEGPNDPGLESDYRAYLEMFNWFDEHDDLSSSEDYEKAQTFIDIDSLIDYFAINMFIANDDWPHNNIVLWRYRTESFPEISDKKHFEDGRFRYILKDVDQSLTGNDIYGADKHTVDRVLKSDDPLYFTPGHFQQSADNRIYYATFPFRKFLTNEEFVIKFIDRLIELMNTSYSKISMLSKIDEIAGKMSPVMEENIRRWGNFGEVETSGRINGVDAVKGVLEWNYNLSLLRDYINTRKDNILKQFKDYKNYDNEAVFAPAFIAPTPVITKQEIHTMSSSKEYITFEVVASSRRGTLSYQWYENTINENSGGKIIEGATDSKYTKNKGGTKYYYCIITNTDEYAAENKTTTVVSKVFKAPSNTLRH